MSINVSIEARMTSSRLPGKVLKKINGVTNLSIMLHRVKKAKKIDKVIVATTTNKEDDVIVDFCKRNHIESFRGSENNVYERVVNAHRYFDTDIIVELTGDCPLIDPAIIDECIEVYCNNDYDYVAADLQYPLGMAVQVYSLQTLESVAKDRELQYEDKEHVTPYLYTSGLYKVHYTTAPKKLQMPELSVTLDTIEDFEVIENVCKNFDNLDFTLGDIIAFARRHPHKVSHNKDVTRKGLS